MSLISLQEVLVRIGFKPIMKPGVSNNASIAGLEYDFGNFKLQVQESTNRRFVDIFYFSGINSTARTLAYIEFVLPVKVESFEQGIAFIAYGLGKNFDAKAIPAWYHQGILWKDHLPGEREKAAYNQKPSLFTDHEYFRLIVRKLRAIALVATEEATTAVSFDGAIVKITCADTLLVAPATGKPWPEIARVKTKDLSRLPERIKIRPGYMYLWQGNLFIDNVAFLATLEPMS